MEFDRHTYDGMRHRFEVERTVRDAELRYPGMDPAAGTLRRTTTAVGTPLRKQDALGRWYFMPVTIRSSLGELELPCAAISMTGKKRIVETTLTGRRGTVNELISVDSYQITLSAVLRGENGDYPERDICLIRDLYELNEAVELESALSDLVLGNDDRIVIETIEFPQPANAEDVQLVRMTARTDAAIELIVE